MRRSIGLAAAAASLVIGNAFAQGEGIYLGELECVGGRFGLKLPPDLRAVKGLSPGVRQELVEVENWPGYTATRKLLHFDGLTLGIIEYSNDPARYLLTFAWVADPRWNAISPFKIMKPVAEAAAVLGAYARDNPGLARPYEDEGDMLTIHSSGGLVTKVTYHCYPG